MHENIRVIGEMFCLENSSYLLIKMADDHEIHRECTAQCFTTNKTIKQKLVQVQTVHRPVFVQKVTYIHRELYMLIYILDK